MSILPIDKTTIIYGSNDCGHTIHARDRKLNRKMRLAAKKLNIKPHRCGVKKRTSKLLSSPADLVQYCCYLLFEFMLVYLNFLTVFVVKCVGGTSRIGWQDLFIGKSNINNVIH